MKKNKLDAVKGPKLNLKIGPFKFERGARVFVIQSRYQPRSSTNPMSLLFVQLKSNTPVLMCSVPGYDASWRVDDMAAELNKTISSIAIGEDCILSSLVFYISTFMGKITL